VLEEDPIELIVRPRFVVHLPALLPDAILVHVSVLDRVLLRYPLIIDRPLRLYDAKLPNLKDVLRPCDFPLHLHLFIDSLEFLLWAIILFALATRGIGCDQGPYDGDDTGADARFGKQLELKLL
jgi:hypothetical protein